MPSSEHRTRKTVDRALAFTDDAAVQDDPATAQDGGR
jgi:hypothetical protein